MVSHTREQTGERPVITQSTMPAGNEFLVAVHNPKVDFWLSASIIQDGQAEDSTLSLFAEHISARLPRLNAPLHVVDVGANIGFITLFLAALSPHIYVTAIEPTPFHYELIDMSLRLNPDLADRIKLFKTALGPAGMSADASLCMRIHETNAASTTASDGACPQDDPRGGVTVPVRTLDDVLAESWQMPVEVLKMDVEGYEMLVLDGAAKLMERPPEVAVVEYIPFRVMAASGLDTSAEAFSSLSRHFPSAQWDTGIVEHRHFGLGKDASTQESLEVVRGWDEKHEGGDLVMRPRLIASS